MKNGCRIIRNIQRPSMELVNCFKGIPVANIDDNMERMGAVDADIKPVGMKGQLLGTAFTVHVPQGDNLMLHAAMDLAEPGDVIVIDAGGYKNRAIFGELMATYCKMRGIKGIICDGAVRDCKGLAELEEFHVYARSFSPNGPYKNGPGEINVPVVVGGKIVHPRDIVVGDEDGLLFVNPNEAVSLAEAAKRVEEKEANIMKGILEEKKYVRPWVDEKLNEIGCEII